MHTTSIQKQNLINAAHSIGGAYKLLVERKQEFREASDLFLADPARYGELMEVTRSNLLDAWTAVNASDFNNKRGRLGI